MLGVEPAAEGRGDRARPRRPDGRRSSSGSRRPSEVAEHGHPRLVAANNVMAHVPDLDDFVARPRRLCDDRHGDHGREPVVRDPPARDQFDTIYHEHFSYLSRARGRPVVARARAASWSRVEQLPTHGGSNRYWLTRTGVRRPTAERRGRAGGGARRPACSSRTLWDDFAAPQPGRHRRPADLARRAARRRPTVAGYGAAAKGNTLMNAAGVRSDDLVVVVDGSEAKQGTFLPGSQRARSRHRRPWPPPTPDDVLILPWNIAPEIRRLVAGLVPEARAGSRSRRCGSSG